jgi:hypothetical protein
MLNWLLRPYPFPAATLKRFFVNLGISIFVALFLMLFQPFGINESQSPFKFLLLAGYGLTCFIAINIFSFILVPLIRSKKNEESWNVLKEILLTLATILFISLANYFYSNLVGMWSFSLKAFFMALFYTTAVGIFPVIFTVVFNHRRLQTKNEKEVKAINEIIQVLHPIEKDISDETSLREAAAKSRPSPRVLIFKSESGNEQLELNPRELLFIEVADNYSQFYFLRDPQVKKELLRGSLRHMENFISGTKIIRCHRSFIVNLENVVNAKGNAQGYKLYFAENDFAVPVSRNYIPEVLELFKSLQKNTAT